MIYQPSLDEASISATPSPSQPLPPGLAMMERAAAALRAFLRTAGLDDYTVFHAHDLDVTDVDRFLPRLDPRAAWQPLPLMPDAHQPHALETDSGPARLEAPGVLHLPRHRFVLARWHYASLKYGTRLTLHLAAAPSAESYEQLHRAVIEHRRRSEEPVWQILRGEYDEETKPRQSLAWSDLLLPPDVARRVEAELVGFFSEPVGALYRSLGVPYRRGVLMHGAPGNGKTSIIRALGAALPEIPALILRPNRSFDADGLDAIFRKWREQAPALLVIEDLDHMLKVVDLSQFLNLIDGVEGSLGGGLLLVATTNHPEALDPALNNRPGRFDVVIEVPCPSADLRRAFFDKHLPGDDLGPTRGELVAATAGLSFAHLQETLRLAGLLAIHDGGGERTPDLLKRSAAMVSDTHRSAMLGFPVSSENPFGLAQFRRRV